MEVRHGRVGANHLMEQFAVSSETVAVRRKHECVLPSYDLATHLHDRSIRIDCAFLVQHLHRSFCRVEDY